MDAILNSFLLVFAGEMGDKTQLLALILVSRFKKPWTIMAGIFVATILNHALASYAGDWVSSLVTPETMRWILGAIFLIFAGWILIPDKDDGLDKDENGHGAFITTTITFFLAENGDKTQLATIALAAKFMAPIAVTFGTTLGMLASNALAVFLGEKLMKKIPMNYIRIFASALFAIFGVLIILGVGK